MRGKSFANDVMSQTAKLLSPSLLHRVLQIHPRFLTQDVTLQTFSFSRRRVALWHHQKEIIWNVRVNEIDVDIGTQLFN